MPVPKGKRLAALIEGSISVALAVLDEFERAELIRSFAGARILPLVYVIGFAAALWLLDSARRDEVEVLEQRRAFVRVNVVTVPVDQQFAFRIRNVGDMEAQRVQIAPLEHSDYPWAAEFLEIGSVPAGDPEQPASGSFKAIADLDCDDCAGKPANLREFFEGLMAHHAHSLELRHATGDSDQSSEDIQYAVGFRIGMAQLTLPLVVNYRDGAGRAMMAVHRLDLQIREGTMSIRCTFGDDTVLSRG
jgi:hypothetical protein